MRPDAHYGTKDKPVLCFEWKFQLAETDGEKIDGWRTKYGSIVAFSPMFISMLPNRKKSVKMHNSGSLNSKNQMAHSFRYPFPPY